MSHGLGRVRAHWPAPPGGTANPFADTLDFDIAGDEPTDPVDLITRLEAEERELILARFDHDAWRLGLLLVGLARAPAAPQ